MRLAAAVGVVLLAGCGPPASPAAPSHAAPAEARAPATRSFEVSERAATIPAAGLALEGTLALPVGSGPWPGVVLLRGSGPLGCDSAMPGQLGELFGFEVAVFRDLARSLAAAGFAVIRYDKRTCTRELGCDNAYPEAEEVEFDRVVEDAQAVIDWLRELPEVDAASVFLIGHSLGGSFVPELMTNNPAARAGVMLAAPYRPIDQVAAYQRDYGERVLLRRNTHPLLVAIRIGELAEIADGLRALRGGIFGGRDLAGAPREFWEAWIDLGDAAPALAERLDRPLLVLSGEADANVPPSETTLWRQRLEAASPDPGHEVEVLPCLTHALNCVAAEPDGRRQPAPHVSHALLERIGDFLLRHHR